MEIDEQITHELIEKVEPKANTELDALGNPSEIQEIQEINNLDDNFEHFDDIETQSIDVVTTHKQGFLPTMFNLMNSLLGAGILSIPNTFVDSGIIISIILLVFIAALSFYATYIVISLQRKTNAEGFGDLAEKTLGHIGAIILSLLTLLFIVSLLLAYLIIAGDILLSWFKLGKVYIVDNFGIRALIMLVYGLTIPISLTIPRNISFLMYFSGANIFFVMFYCIVIIYKGIYGLSKTKKINLTTKHWKLDMEVFNSLSIYALTFALPCVVLPPLSPYTYISCCNDKCATNGYDSFIDYISGYGR